MGIDFYLSQMSVPDRHGGGLTLPRAGRRVSSWSETARLTTEVYRKVAR
jgi:hypothetical protein